MALVVVSKPSGFQPVGTGELNYVFSQASIPGAGYHIEIELNGFSTPKFYFYPDSTGVITCNISPMLRANLLMSPTITERFKNTYVKYQEVWDAGSNAQVPLSSDVIYFYIGSNNVLNSRTTFTNGTGGGVFLTSQVNGWSGRTTYADLILDGTITNQALLYLTNLAGTYYAVAKMETGYETFSVMRKKLLSVPFELTESGTLKVREFAWTGRTQAEANNWVGIATDGTVFVAISSNGTHRAQFATDLTNWLTGSPSALAYTDIAYGLGVFIACANGQVSVSSNGFTWASYSTSTAASWASIAYGDNTFVVVGTNVVNYSRNNGATWIAATCPSHSWTKVRYVNGLFIAGCSGSANLMTSPDGITWTDRTVTKNVSGIAYGNGMYLTVGNNSSPEGMTSTDGITWTEIDLPGASVAWTDIVFGEGVFTLLSTGLTSQTVNAVDFTYKPSVSASAWNAVTYGNGTFVAVGNSGAASGVMTGVSTATGGTVEAVFHQDCLNPLYLKWLNDFGGLSTWLFDYNQVLNMIPNEADGRYKKMIVFLNQGSIDEWKALQELNRSGAEYGDNKKLGAYVVDFTDESNPINIFVEPNPASTLTKYTGNNTQLTLRYPLAENILI